MSWHFVTFGLHVTLLRFISTLHCLFCHVSLIHWLLTQSLSHWLFHAFVISFVGSFIHWFVHFISLHLISFHDHSFHSFHSVRFHSNSISIRFQFHSESWVSPSLVHSYIHSLIHSYPFHSLIHSLSHSCTDSFTSSHWHLSNHLLIRCAPHNLNISLLLPLTNIPIDRAFLIASAPARPGII